MKEEAFHHGGLGHGKCPFDDTLIPLAYVVATHSTMRRLWSALPVLSGANSTEDAVTAIKGWLTDPDVSPPAGLQLLSCLLQRVGDPRI